MLKPLLNILKSRPYVARKNKIAELKYNRWLRLLLHHCKGFPGLSAAIDDANRTQSHFESVLRAGGKIAAQK